MFNFLLVLQGFLCGREDLLSSQKHRAFSFPALLRS
jgi:hypothetical protein